MTTETDDVSGQLLSRATNTAQTQDVNEMEAWLRDFEAGDKAAGPVRTEPMRDYPVTGRPLPAPEPRKPTDDPLGRQKPKGKDDSYVKQIVGGVEDAFVNSGLHGLLDPLANWLNDNVIDLRYGRMEAPQTTSGTMVRKLTEFFTGFVPALKGLRMLGMSGNIAAPMVAGVIADFTVRDPHEGRLTDIILEAGLPRNVVTDYLKSNPNDSGAEARFKNSLEGVGMGAAVEGLMLSARLLRAAKHAPGVKQSEEQFLKAKYGEVPEATIREVIGDERLPVVGAVEAPIRKVDAAGKELPVIEPRALIRGKKGEILSEDFEVFVNFARFDEPDQIKFVIGKMADAGKGKIDEATRGVITQKETQRLADDLGMTVADLLQRRKGQPFNAEQAVAARTLWAGSAEKLLELAKKASVPNAGPLDHFAFRRQMAVHAAIQAEVIGARTETARALASWRIEAKGGIERARAIEQIMSATGGPNASKEMARRLSILADNGADAATIGRIAEKGWVSASVDAIRQVWINGLLSSPKTHVVNTMSNTLVAFQQIYERAAASGIRSFTGGEGVVSGESTAMLYGAIESLKDAFRLSAKALRTGESQWAFGKVDTLRPDALSADAFRISKETGLGRTVDTLGAVAGVPGRLLQAEDEFFKTIGYRMELHAQALRTATQEGHRGVDLARRVDEIVKDPPEFIRIGAADAALYNTFTNEMGAFGRSIMNMRNIDHPLNPAVFVLPFVRTPVNIARYAFERTPFAPLVSQWRDDIAAGGARADLALSRMATGTSIMLVAMDLADSGIVSGKGPAEAPKREALQRQGWKEYSVKVGDRWYSYNRADPFGMTMGFAADIAEAVRKGDIDQDAVDEWHEVAAMAIAAVAQVTVSKTYLQGFANMVEVLLEPKRHAQSYVQDMMASFLPATSLMSAVKNVVDPVRREAQSPADAVRARIAGLSKDLPPRRDLWGKELTTESGLGKIYDFVSPVASSKHVNSPVDREIVRLNMSPERINRKTNFGGVEVNLRHHPQVYDDYTRLSGNELKHPTWNMGAKDYLNAVISGTHPLSASYKILSDEGQKAFIQSTIGEYRKIAQQQILADPKHAAFNAEYSHLRRIHDLNRMPVLGE